MYKTILTAVTVMLSIGLSNLTQAELLQNSWAPFEIVVPNDPEAPCGEADAFVVEGFIHTKVSTLRKGGLAINVNAQGTLTPLGEIVDDPAIFRQNVRDVLPIDGDNVVYNFGETIKVISKVGPNYRLNSIFHVTLVGGEVKSYLPCLSWLVP